MVIAHFLDHHVLQNAGYEQNSAACDREASIAFRLCIISGKRVVIPAVSYIESRLCRAVVDPFQQLFLDGTIKIIGDGYSLAELAENRVREYKRGSPEFKLYSKVLRTRGGKFPPFTSSTSNTTTSLHASWRKYLESRILPTLLPMCSLQDHAKLQTVLTEVPHRLEGRAFTGGTIVSTLGEERLQASQGAITKLVNELFFEHIQEGCNGTFVKDLSYIYGGVPQRAPMSFSYTRALSELRQLSSRGRRRFASLTGQGILGLIHDPEFAALLKVL